MLTVIMAGSKWIVSTLAASAIGAAGYFLGKDDNRKRVNDYIKRAQAEIKGETKEDTQPDFYEKVGHSDPLDVEDNSMVDEGSTFAVNYYNQNLKGNEEEGQSPEDTSDTESDSRG
ncbi:MAG: hypothetical protein EA344_11755 [Alkalicoccus sp.]|nr:MAG: hypothetical protein EA344_11755 [Alkalicoccus sp.]